eukprot:603722-Pyramimonas_sp.AAC.1
MESPTPCQGALDTASRRSQRAAGSAVCGAPARARATFAVATASRSSTRRFSALGGGGRASSDIARRPRPLPQAAVSIVRRGARQGAAGRSFGTPPAGLQGRRRFRVSSAPPRATYFVRVALFGRGSWVQFSGCAGLSLSIASGGSAAMGRGGAPVRGRQRRGGRCCTVPKSSSLQPSASPRVEGPAR